MKIETSTEWLPAFWASALINCDESGMSDDEINGMRQWLDNNPQYGGCFDCGEDTDLRIFDGLLTDCAEFTFPVNHVRTTENGAHYLISPVHVTDKPMTHHKLNLTRTASGYGRKIPTTKIIRLCGRSHRVYCTIFSNAGTCWINFRGMRVIVDSAL